MAFNFEFPNLIGNHGIVIFKKFSKPTIVAASFFLTILEVDAMVAVFSSMHACKPQLQCQGKAF